MIAASRLRTWLVVLLAGLWAGSAAAQAESPNGGGEWFDEPAEERPLLRIEGKAKGKYDPPPADFQSDPPSGYSPPETLSSEEDVEEPEPEDVEAEREGQARGYREFSPRLAPYGYWVDDPIYGRVWVPHRNVVGPDFAPYVSAGHWELTPEDEWLWVSDYPFGWITFHYGRWVWTGAGSWGWVPGYVYAPAWVRFRVGSGGYIGWGPVAPLHVWRGGLFVSVGVYRPVPYIFCPTTYVFAPSVTRYVVRDRYRVRSIASRTYVYRPSRAGAYHARVRYPSPVEARIPARVVPRQRVVARPRLSEGRLELSRGEFRQRRGEVRGSRDPQWNEGRSRAPERIAPRTRTPERSDRQREYRAPRDGQRQYRAPTERQREYRAPAAPNGNGARVRPREAPPYRGAPVQRARPDAASRVPLRSPAPAVAPRERREIRAAPRPSGGNDGRPPPRQQRIRDRDGRGSESRGAGR